MKPSQILTMALNKIKNPKNWIKDNYALDKHGNPTVYTISPKAVCWCLSGALWAFKKDPMDYDNSFVAEEILDNSVAAYIGNSYTTIPSFNDDKRTTHKDVINVLKQAIQIAKNVGE